MHEDYLELSGVLESKDRIIWPWFLTTSVDAMDTYNNIDEDINPEIFGGKSLVPILDAMIQKRDLHNYDVWFWVGVISLDFWTKKSFQSHTNIWFYIVFLFPMHPYLYLLGSDGAGQN